jgi:hypothetical protein
MEIMHNMRLSIPRKLIFTIITTATLFVLGSCGATIGVPNTGNQNDASINFRYRTDSARPGDYRGPFSGVVRDKSSKYPVKGATVTIYYYFTKNGKPLSTSKSIVKTDVNGKYFISKLNKFPIWSPGVKLSKIDLHIYHKNYFTFLLSSLGGYFTQYDNLVILRRDSALVRSHKKLIKSIAIPGNESRLVSSYYQAANELSKNKGSRLDAGALLLPEHVQKLLKKDSLPSLIELRSKPEESGYLMKFSRGGVVSWNVWSMMTHQAVNRKNQYISQLKDTKEIPWFSLKSKAWSGISEDMRVLVILLKDRGNVIAVGCSKSLCSEKQLVLLGQAIMKRSAMLIFMEEWGRD